MKTTFVKRTWKEFKEDKEAVYNAVMDGILSNRKDFDLKDDDEVEFVIEVQEVKLIQK